MQKKSIVTSKTKDFIEMIKLDIRAFRIRFSKRISKDKKGNEINLLCKLKQLNVLLDQNPQDPKLAKEAERVRLEL